VINSSGATWAGLLGVLDVDEDVGFPGFEVGSNGDTDWSVSCELLIGIQTE
jgi:hypothetical protein